MPSTTTEEKRPTELDIGMSNFDHSIDEGLDAALRKEKNYAHHGAWDFSVYVWFEDGRFHEDIWRYRSHIYTLTADSLVELLELVIERYGDA